MATGSEVVLARSVSVTSSMSAAFKRLRVGRANGRSADQSPRENHENDAAETSVMAAHPGPRPDQSQASSVQVGGSERL